METGIGFFSFISFAEKNSLDFNACTDRSALDQQFSFTIKLTKVALRDKVVILVKQHNEDTSIVCCIKIQADYYKLIIFFIYMYYFLYNKNETLKNKSIILNTRSKFRHQNVVLYSMKNGLSFWYLPRIAFNSLIKLLVFIKINFMM